MGKDGEPYDPDLDIYRHMNGNEPKPLPFSPPPVPHSPPPDWPGPVNTDYPNFYTQPIDENDLSYIQYLNPAIFEPDSTDESCNNGAAAVNNNTSNATNTATNNNDNATQAVECNGGTRRNKGIIRGDDIVVGVRDRNDVLEIIDVSDESDHTVSNNNVIESTNNVTDQTEDERISREMINELLGDFNSLEELVGSSRNNDNNNCNNNVEENAKGKDKGKAVIVEPVPDLDIIRTVMVDDGREGEAGASAGPSGTGRVRFHRVPLGCLDCSSCHVSGGLYANDDPRFAARISIHGLDGMYNHLIFEIQNSDPLLAQEVEMFIFDMSGLPIERINEDLAFYNIQINQNGEIELHETFLNIYRIIQGRPFLPPINADVLLANPGCYEQMLPSGNNINYDFDPDFMMVGGEESGVQPIPYSLEAPIPTPLAIEAAPQQPLMIDTAPQQALMLEMPPPNYSNHHQHQLHRQQQHHYNQNAMPYHPNASPQGMQGMYLPAPNQFAAGPSRVNRSMEADPLSFLDHEIPDWMRGPSSPEPEEEDDQHRPPRPTVGIQRERTANMSPLDLAPYFHIKADQASSKLKVCSTTLKIMCRKKGLKRWPYRKIRSIDNKIIGLRRILQENVKRGDRAAIMSAEMDIHKMRGKRIELYRSILKMMSEHREEDDNNKRQ